MCDNISFAYILRDLRVVQRTQNRIIPNLIRKSCLEINIGLTVISIFPLISPTICTKIEFHSYWPINQEESI